MHRWLLLGLLITAGMPVQAELLWQPLPSTSGHAGHGGRGKSFVLQDGAGAQVHMVTPRLDSVAQLLHGEVLRFRPSGLAGYYALVAERSRDGVVETALRYEYRTGKPSGKSPADLLARPKAALDIVPAPLPREHWRYQSGKRAVFEVRFAGFSVADVPVTLRTAAGTVLSGTTDLGGRVVFLLPDDLPQLGPGRKNNPPGEFVVDVHYAAEQTSHITRLSMPYYTNPARWQSFGWGVTAALLGFAGGVVVIRRNGHKGEGAR
jgi:hypothetical protein